MGICNETCVISEQHQEGCDELGVCDWAEQYNSKTGGIVCGCTSCIEDRLGEYGCTHSVFDACYCIDVVFYGEAEGGY